MKSSSWIIIELGMVLLIMGTLSFFYTPKDDKHVSLIINTFTVAFSTVIGYKFGRAMPQQANDPKAGEKVESISNVVKTKTEG